MITIPHYAPVYNVDLWFDGKSDCVALSPVVTFPGSQITFECWIKTLTQVEGTLLTYVRQSINLFSVLNVTNLNVFVNGMQASPGGTGIALNDGSWHFLSITWNGASGALRIYVDGVFKSEYTVAPGSFLMSGGSMALGLEQVSDPGQVPFEGSIAEVRIWNKARTGFFINQDQDRTILRTNDTVLWQRIQHDTVKDKKLIRTAFTTVAPADETAIYATDSDNLIWFTQDFGRTWSQPNADQKLVQVAAIPSVAMGLNAEGRISVSTDSGKTWTQPNPGAALSQIALATDFAIGVNSNQTVYYSPDYGTTWNQGDDTKLTCVATDGGLAWGLDGQGVLYKSTTKQATHWQAVPNAPVLSSISSIANMLVGITPAALLTVSEDGGNTWRDVLPPYDMLYRYAFPLQNVLWAVDANGYLVFAEINTLMQLHWSMDEGYGNVAYDASGNRNNGVLGENGTSPTWKVSSMLVQPGFAVDPYSLRLDRHSGERPESRLSGAPPRLLTTEVPRTTRTATASKAKRKTKK